jgi:hypothetical protein
MVGHKYIGMKGTTVAASCLAKPIKVDAIIGFVKEQGISIVSTLNHVQRISGHKKTR